MPGLIKQKIVVSVDGLSLGDFEVLCSLMPRSFGGLHGNVAIELVRKTLPSAHVVWAEVLTGKRWFESGCVGYSRPNSSLNKLSVNSERDLAGQVLPTSSEELQVVINVPLLLAGANRIWLSDGSTPGINVVAPPDLKKIPPFSDYVPRPVKSFVESDFTLNEVIDRCLEVESIRLRCFEALCERKWSRFIYRLSLFDQLSHLLGTSYLLCEDLSRFAAIRQFLDKFDCALHSLLSNGSIELAVVSGYSHDYCRGLLNLNRYLEKGQFLKIDQDVDDNGMRIGSVQSMFGHAPARGLLESMEGRLVSSETSAASPISGTVYVNRKWSFRDGTIDGDKYLALRNEISSFIKDELTKSFGGTVAFESNPCEVVSGHAPEMVVYIQNVDFHNMNNFGSVRSVVPRTMHSPKGFISLPKSDNLPVDLKFTDIKDCFLYG